MNLRPYQAVAVEAVVDYAIEHPKGRLLITIPPGGGKTVVGAAALRILAAEQGLRALVLAHRREIVLQHYSHLIRCGVPEDMIGVIMSKDERENPKAPIQVASIDTLSRRAHPPADLLVPDEAHRDASEGRRKLRTFYPDAFVLGLTGTPHRSDRRPLREDYDELLSISSPSELIANGWLSAPRVFTVRPEDLPDLNGVRTLAGDFELSSLGAAVNRPKLVGNIIEHWGRLADKRRTVVFAVNIAHSKEIVDRFTAAGVRAEHLDQDTSVKDRQAVLDAFWSGRVSVISCVNILAEGWDCPPCKCVIQARPTKSLSLHLQQTGRCMRPWEGVVPLILDHAGNMVRQRHGLPQMDREWSLDLPPRGSASGGEAPAKMCPGCGAVMAAGCIECPECGMTFSRAVTSKEVEGELEDYQKIADVGEKRAEFERILMFSRRKNFPDQWASQVYEAKYGERPPPLM